MNINKLKLNIQVPEITKNTIQDYFHWKYKKRISNENIIYFYNIITNKNCCDNFLKSLNLNLYKMYNNSFIYFNKNDIDNGHILFSNPICYYFFTSIIKNSNNAIK